MKVTVTTQTTNFNTLLVKVYRGHKAIRTYKCINIKHMESMRDTVIATLENAGHTVNNKLKFLKLTPISYIGGHNAKSK